MIYLCCYGYWFRFLVGQAGQGFLGPVAVAAGEQIDTPAATASRTLMPLPNGASRSPKDGGSSTLLLISMVFSKSSWSNNASALTTRKYNSGTTRYWAGADFVGFMPGVPVEQQSITELHIALLL